jgi:transposase
MLGALRDEGAFRMPPSKVELYAAIRRESRAGMSGRAIGRKYRVGRRTVAKALSSAWPEPRKPLPPRASKLDPFKPAIDGMLTADLDAPRKQRHTITRIHRRLMDEHGRAGVSYPVVRAYVAVRKPQIRAEAGRGPAEVFVPQSHRPGEEAEVDFGEAVVRLGGEDVGCFLFCLRLSFSGKGSRCRAGKRPSSRATITRSGCWAGCRRGRSATTASRRRSRR